jgi:hypothetical protein
MFYRRDREQGNGPYLLWKLSLFFLAAGVWIAGVLTGRPWATGTALVLLIVAILLRFLPQRGDPED